MATQLSRKRRTQSWKEKMLWEDEDSHIVSAGQAASGGAFIQLTHSKIVEHHEFEVFINGVKLAPTQFALDPARGEVNVLFGPWVQAGDVIRFHYAYHEYPSDRPVAMSYVASSAFGRQTTAVTSLALPTGTQKHDTVFVVAKGGNAAITDPRFTEIHNSSFYGVRGAFGFMVVENNLDPIQVAMDDSGGWWKYVAAFTLRGVEGPIHPDPGLKAVQGSSYSTTAPLPELNLKSGRASGAVCLYLTAGGIGGVYAAQSWAKASPQWSLAAVQDYSYVEVDVAVTDDLPVAGVPTPNTDPDVEWMAVVIGVGTDA